jgi:hypothetical protein
LKTYFTDLEREALIASGVTPGQIQAADGWLSTAYAQKLRERNRKTQQRWRERQKSLAQTINRV